jgi:hypothetical protein
MALSFLHHDPTEHEELHFSDILDSLMLMHVILQETKETLAALRATEGMVLVSDSSFESS